MPRFDSPEHLSAIGTYLRDKYRQQSPTVLVATGEEALRFLLQHRDDLFAGVPLVFSGVGRTALRELEPLPEDVVGIPLELDFVGTVTQAMAWHPKARRLWIVTGAAEWDRLSESRLRIEAATFSGRLTVEHLSALPAAELFARLAALGSESIVFTLGFFQDGAGRNFVPRESVEAMATASGAPVYGAYATILGTGAVGGFVSSFADAGREAGRATAQVLAGTPLSSLQLPAKVPSILQADWRQIRRFKIAERSIPATAVVLFREPTLFEAYRLQVLVAAGVLALQAVLIGLLLEERRRRRAAELSEQGRRTELAHASRLAVAGELLGSIAHEINQPLGAILSNADAAEMILDAGGDRRAELGAILADIRRDDLRASEVIRRLRALLSRNEVERQRFDLLEAAREVESLLRSEARRRGVTHRAPDPGAGRRRPVPWRSYPDPAGPPESGAQRHGRRRRGTGGAACDHDRARSRPARDSEAAVAISVRDRGQGIAPENLPKLFDSFFTTKGQGMGLGLSIARTLVEAHGGRIRAESVPGEGSVFRVELPGRQPKETA